MNIILEGPDASGKSTLAAHLSEAIGVRVQQGSGPPRRAGEIEDRLRTYLTMSGVIFDRHPAISQPIYGMLRGEPPSTEFADLVAQFYRTPALLVYCRGTSLERHVVKEGESPSHIATIHRKHGELLAAYDAWGLANAQCMYRIGDSPSFIVAAWRGQGDK